MSYQEKYLKYKNKYLELRSNSKYLNLFSRSSASQINKSQFGTEIENDKIILNTENKNKFLNLRKQIEEFNIINEDRKIKDFHDPINKNKYLELRSNSKYLNLFSRSSASQINKSQFGTEIENDKIILNTENKNKFISGSEKLYQIGAANQVSPRSTSLSPVPSSRPGSASSIPPSSRPGSISPIPPSFRPGSASLRPVPSSRPGSISPIPVSPIPGSASLSPVPSFSRENISPRPVELKLKKDIYIFVYNEIERFTKKFYRYDKVPDLRVENIGRMTKFITTHLTFIKAHLINTRDNIFPNIYTLFINNRIDRINRDLINKDIELYLGLFSILRLFALPDFPLSQYDNDRMILLNSIYGGKKTLLVDGLNIIRNKSILVANLFLFQKNQDLFDRIMHALTRISTVDTFTDDYILLREVLPIILKNYIKDMNIIIIAPRELNDKIDIDINILPREESNNIISFIFVPNSIDGDKTSIREVDDLFLILLFRLINRQSNTHILSGDTYSWYTENDSVRLNRCCLIINSRLFKHDERLNEYTYYTSINGIIPIENFHYEELLLSRPLNLIFVGLYLNANKEEQEVNNMKDESNFLLLFNPTDITGYSRNFYDSENIFMKQLIYSLFKNTRILPDINIMKHIIVSSDSTVQRYGFAFSVSNKFKFVYTLLPVPKDNLDEAESELIDNIVIEYSKQINDMIYKYISQSSREEKVIKIEKILSRIKHCKTRIRIDLFELFIQLPHDSEREEILPNWDVLNRKDIKLLTIIFKKHNIYTEYIKQYKNLLKLELNLTNQLPKEHLVAEAIPILAEVKEPPPEIKEPPPEVKEPQPEVKEPLKLNELEYQLQQILDLHKQIKKLQSDQNNIYLPLPQQTQSDQDKTNLPLQSITLESWQEYLSYQVQQDTLIQQIKFQLTNYTQQIDTITLDKLKEKESDKLSKISLIVQNIETIYLLHREYLEKQLFQPQMEQIFGIYKQIQASQATQDEINIDRNTIENYSRHQKYQEKLIEQLKLRINNFAKQVESITLDELREIQLKRLRMIPRLVQSIEDIFSKHKAYLEHQLFRQQFQ